LYHKPSWTGAWVVIKGSVGRITVDQMPNGTILGVDTTGGLSYRNNLTQPAWFPAPSSVTLASTKTLNDGTILGMGRDGWVALRLPLLAGCCTSSCEMPMAGEGGGGGGHPA
jgi:hypothetical protein